VKGNVLFPADVDELVAVVRRDTVPLSPEATVQIVAAGPEFFLHAGELAATHAADFKGWTRAIAAATGCKGAQLFMPLRSALTGATHGPELAPLVALMGGERARQRLEHARALAANP
jgi:glutamyl-tRNA synthetase